MWRQLPTAQTSFDAEPDTAARAFHRLPTFGVGTATQAEPLQWTASVATVVPRAPPSRVPTAHTSLAASELIASRDDPPAKAGLDTSDQLEPSQRWTRVCGVPKVFE